MKRNLFSLSHSRLTSFDMGYLVPVMCLEVLPGDTIQQSTHALIRCSPLLAPVMHRVDVRIHHWYVPHRINWVEFEDFITGGADGLNASVPPYIDLSGVTISAGHIWDQIGIGPSGTYPATQNRVSALPLRAYFRIWNEFYRDQDLQTELAIATTSGADGTVNGYEMQRVCWEKDYLTSSRPWEQKGATITIPIGDTAPVNRITSAPTWKAFDAGTNTAAANSAMEINTGNVRRAIGTTNISLDPNGGLEADLSAASAVTINVLREALALQRYQEARARFGSRYTEYLQYLGVRPQDARLQRPEYLGGGRQVVQFSEVLQTGPGTDPVGDLKGHGIAGARTNRYRRFIPEHGLILSLMSVRPKTIYRQGIHRSMIRTTKEDYWQKELEHIGQQEVQNREAYGIHATPMGQFGFQDRYDEYRRAESMVTGQFGSTLLNHWHFAREFASAPALNSSFVECVPTDRTFAVPSEDVLFVMCNHSIQARRMVSKSGSSFIF